MDGEEEKTAKKHPREGANALSAITFAWLRGTFLEGYKRDLDVDDLTEPLTEHKSSILGEKISKAWEDEVQRTRINNRNLMKTITPSLKKVLLKLFGIQFAIYGLVLAIMQLFFKVLQPIALGKLLRYYSKNKNQNEVMTQRDAIFYAILVILCSAVGPVLSHPPFMGIMHVGMKMRIACCSLVYRKILRLSQTALGEKSIGQILNLLSNDVSRFDNSVLLLNFLWISPLQTIIVTYLMYREIGLPAVFGVSSLLLFVPLQGWLGKKISFYRRKTAVRTDERVRLTNEIISGIQAIKMYAWEHLFGDLIERARKKEIGAVRALSSIMGVIMSFTLFTSRLALFITILTVIFERGGDEIENQEEKIITAEKVFMLAAYFNLLRQTMTVLFPQGITMMAEISVSIERIQMFMLSGEMDTPRPRYLQSLQQANGKSDDSEEFAEGSIVLERVCAKWLASDREDILKAINMRIIPGQLVAIVGQVGSGKSSLLNVLLKELKIHHGTMNIHGKLTYASQEPWLFAGSVRTNILFGREMDQKKYKQVVKVCQLKRDFELFPRGDQTIVGERGVSLSGGQRARINLARAVYADASIYLLDDPLSAVDAHVGKHMFRECIETYLRDKTRIIVTHQIQLLKDVDKIIVMEEGSIIAEGTYDELKKMGVNFGDTSAVTSEEDDSASEIITRKRLISICSVSSGVTNISGNETIPIEEAEIEPIEDVDSKAYSLYFNAAGNFCLISFVALLFLITQLFVSGGEWFIAAWVNLEEKPANKTSGESKFSLLPSDRISCIRVYAFIIITMITITFIRSFVFFKICMRASKRLHDRMFRSVLLTPMSFFYKNPSGRVLNRFSNDMGAVDELIPKALIDCLQISLFLSGIIIVVVLSNPLLMIPVVFLGAIFYYLRIFFLATSRSIKQLERMTRSPVLTHLSATVQGLATIRSFNAGEILTKEFDQHQDLHSSAWYTFIASSRALGFWTDIICLAFIIIVTLSFVLLDNKSTEGGSVGLAITQSVALTGMLQYGVRQSTELDNQMTSVERISEYSNLEKETPLETPAEKKPKKDWPSRGRIQFRNISLSYTPLEAPVLRNLEFTIEPKEKIGIVGRTGAGKSSLIAALFRFANLEGSILIDGVNTGEIGIHDLRSKISIIPQEPFLFAGTLRRNLDPFDSYPDNSLWAALEDVELKEMGLEAHINEGGSNLSVGQRQLFCLARAILKNNRILILDEATANVDFKTDQLIQQTIRRKFADCTVLTIAHRLNTVMDSDKILVMDAGSVVEFDHPHLLLQNPEGALSSMIEETGQDMVDVLRHIAEENFELQQETKGICS